MSTTLPHARAARWPGGEPRWQVLASPDAVVIGLRPGRAGLRRAIGTIRSLPPGTSLVVADSRPGGRLRARRLIGTGLIALQRQYVALPSLRAPVLVAQDTPGSLRFACRALVTAPPGVTRGHAAFTAAVGCLRRYPQLASWLAGGRLLVGTRT